LIGLSSIHLVNKEKTVVVPASIGNKIRQYRKAQQFTLEEFAEQCDISVSFLSQIERDLAQPSISTLYAIGDALHLSISEFFTDESTSNDPQPLPEPIPPAKVVRADHRKVIVYPGAGIRNEFLSPDSHNHIQMMWIIMPPHSSSGDVPFVHEGEECGVILKGQLETLIADEKFILGPGDAIYHDSKLPHISRNNGDEKVVMVVAKTLPRSGSTDGNK
jgi:transcriptional regulator with XRE-family HTH domain